jgi:hypothetical protein
MNIASRSLHLRRLSLGVKGRPFPQGNLLLNGNTCGFENFIFCIREEIELTFP